MRERLGFARAAIPHAARAHQHDIMTLSTTGGRCAEELKGTQQTTSGARPRAAPTDRQLKPAVPMESADFGRFGEALFAPYDVRARSLAERASVGIARSRAFPPTALSRRRRSTLACLLRPPERGGGAGYLPKNARPCEQIHCPQPEGQKRRRSSQGDPGY